MSSSQDSNLHNEKQLRLQHLYGRVPNKEDLLAHQLEGRKYFDSGDFALSQAHKSSNIGAVKTGSDHPLRAGISHPSSAVPSSSNVNDDGHEQLKGEWQAGLVRSGSQLHREMARQTPGESGEAKQDKKV
ncbi:camp-regulated phosphoprotein family protein Igo1 [Ilyonectria sp. MPI-CAGE-AT-0026]|nr:camp-regulated phosphoprotein family protein Igo1 [Ilyonectria sp. MPI-CAGE-AT-0026]